MIAFPSLPLLSEEGDCKHSHLGKLVPPGATEVTGGFTSHRCHQPKRTLAAIENCHFSVLTPEMIHCCHSIVIVCILLHRVYII